MRVDIKSVFLMTVAVILSTNGQTVYDCPIDWLEYNEQCYKFIQGPQLTFQEAEIACGRQHSSLVRVNSEAEHNYINRWLVAHDGNKGQWITSGMKKGGKYIWTFDGSEISGFHFLNEDKKNEKVMDEKNYIVYNLIVYGYEKTENAFYWNWGRVMTPASYICEVPKSDVWKFYQAKRDFAFLTGEYDSKLWPLAPNITQQSKNTVFFKRISGKVTKVVLECLASGNPNPNYQWYKTQTDGTQTVMAGESTYYTITNGRLTIDEPDSDRDVGSYHCEASNKYGTVLSDPIRLSYGKLGQFPPVITGEYYAKMYMGVEIDCQPPSYKPAAQFNWFKEPMHKPVLPELNPQFFISQNGKLYISEVAAPESYDYSCLVKLAPRPGETLASSNAISRNSKFITLKVQGDNANTYGPDIQDKFPQVFPTSPLIGQRMTLECLAYGRLPLQYSWVRQDAPMNSKAYTMDSGRVLIIEEALLQDTGAYTCLVSGFKASTNKTRYIKMSGVPSFPIPLQNQFLDLNSKFTWSCLALGVPLPTYSWYKDGRLLPSVDVDLGISIQGRHLTFDSVNEKHNGVYQCEAKNTLGVRRSNAQVKAVSFKPTFDRNPLPGTVFAAVGGRAEIKCRPHAAPRAAIEWTRKGGGGLGANGVVMPDGTLSMSDLKVGDSGTYTCQATNSLGSVSGDVELKISGSTVLTDVPGDPKVFVGGSTSLLCKASFDESDGEIVYNWKLYDHVINFDEDIDYDMPYVDKGSGALYLISAQYKHEGRYTCLVSTATSMVSHSGYLQVMGPPDEPVGVHRHMTETTKNSENSIELWWAPGKTHAEEITKYAVEARPVDQGDLQDGVLKEKSEKENVWELLQEVRDAETHMDTDGHTGWRRTVVSTGLSPGTSYIFRVRAGSEGGYGAPSKPSAAYKMKDAAPIYPVPKVWGGGGKERELQIKWEPLPRSHWGADHIRYIVYYRRKDGDRIDGKWIKTREMTKTRFEVVISAEYYYLPYEVKVQGVNDLGEGPNSTMVEVLSAELKPKIHPIFQRASATNATAGIVSWNRIPNTRETVNGSIFAFQVDYWIEDSRCLGSLEYTALFTRVYGDVTSALIIGLMPGADYCLNIRLLNHAGMGPKGSNYWLGMNYPPPSKWPEYVTIKSHGADSVRVTWKGVTHKFGEDPIRGYKAWYWSDQEDIRLAKVKDFGRAFTGVIDGIERNRVYRLRIMAYNSGGDGKKAPDVMFTLGGAIRYYPLITDVMNSAPKLFAPITIPLTLAMLLCYFK